MRQTRDERRAAREKRLAETQGVVTEDQESSKLIDFAFYLANGQSPLEAYQMAKFVNRQKQAGPIPTEEEIEGRRQRAQELSESVRVVTLVQAVRSDPQIILRNALGALAMKSLELAFNAKNEMVRFKAIQDCMSRGGLPSETVQYQGTSGDLQKATTESLRERAKKILETINAMEPAVRKKVGSG
jgi:hypothetical protein